MESEQSMTPRRRWTFLRANGVPHGKVSKEAYEKMYTAQNGLCAICGEPETSKNRYGVKSLSVDHDHETGEVRGLLCSNCNFALSFFKDDIVTLEKAIEYLQSVEAKKRKAAEDERQKAAEREEAMKDPDYWFEQYALMG